MPFTIDEDLKAYYYRAFQMYKYLVDTYRRRQDKYNHLVIYFKI